MKKEYLSPNMLIVKIETYKPMLEASDGVIGTGGYICGATISSAHKLHIPTMLHESNAFPGKAVKMLAKKTDTILVAFEDAKNYQTTTLKSR